MSHLVFIPGKIHFPLCPHKLDYVILLFESVKAFQKGSLEIILLNRKVCLVLLLMECCVYR